MIPFRHPACQVNLWAGHCVALPATLARGSLPQPGLEHQNEFDELTSIDIDIHTIYISDIDIDLQNK